MERFAGSLMNLYRTNMRVIPTLSVLPPSMKLLGGIGLALALWYGSEQIGAGRLSTGGLHCVHGRAVSDVCACKEAQPGKRKPPAPAVAAGDRIFEMMDTDTEVAKSPTALMMPPFSSAIDFGM